MSRSVIRDGDRILKEILNLVSEGYTVSFRPDIEDAYQIRLQKDGFSSARAITNDAIRCTTAMDAEEYVLHTLYYLRSDLERWCNRLKEEMENG